MRRFESGSCSLVAPPPASPDSDIHPLGLVIASVIQDGAGGTTVLTDDGLEYVRRALDEYLDSGEDLMDAVDTVLVAAHLIEVEQRGRAAAERLVTLVDRPEVVAAMRRITEAAETAQAQVVAQSAERFSKFSGDTPSTTVSVPNAAGAGSTLQRSRPQAASPDASPSDSKKGALRLGDLAFPRRL